MFKTYSNAPIKEAILDINLKEINLIDIDQVREDVKKDLPKGFKLGNNIVSFGGEIKITKGKPEVISSKEILKGFIIEKNNIKFQFRKDGFSLNFLSPYSNWDELFSFGNEFWEIYKKNFNVSQVEKISLRYINEIKIPLPLGDFEDYIVNMPPIPKCLPQNYSHFFMQIEVPCDNDFIALVTETILQEKEKYILPFVLDINIQKFIKSEFNNKAFKEEFNYMRRLKNLIFEDFITDNTRKLFE
jgi:uncharacterized protein (TIGR04255 family)